MGGTPGHKYRKGKEPKKPVKTAEEAALEKRQSRALDDEIEESEEKFAALARNTLGRGSLLGGMKKGESGARASRTGGASGVGGISAQGGGSGQPSTVKNRSILSLARAKK